MNMIFMITNLTNATNVTMILKSLPVSEDILQPMYLKVCERMSYEESKNIFYICRYISPIDLDGYFATIQGFYTKILKTLIWLIKALIDSGRNGYYTYLGY